MEGRIMDYNQMMAEIRRLEREVSVTVRERDEARGWHNDLRARIEDVEGMAITLSGGIECWEMFGEDRREGYRNDARFVSRYLKEG
jgi:hypothetical protein